MNLARALKPRFFRTPPIRISGWWYTYPPEKYKSQLGWLFPIYGKIKHVPKQQPDMRIGHSGGWGGVGGAITFMSLETTTFYALALLLHLHTHMPCYTLGISSTSSTRHATLWGSSLAQTLLKPCVCFSCSRSYTKPNKFMKLWDPKSKS